MMKLKLDLPGASDAEAQAGLTAAMTVFSDAGLNPFEASCGMSEIEAWDDAGFPDQGEDALSKDDERAANVWMDACAAAVTAATQAWSEKPSSHTHSLIIEMSEDEWAQVYGDAAEGGRHL